MTLDYVGIASIVSFLLGWIAAGIWMEAQADQPSPRPETDNAPLQVPTGTLSASAADADGVLKQSLPPGTRAVGIELDLDIPGYLFAPGSHIDIIWIGRAEGGKEPLTKVLLQDVIVLEASCRGMGQGNSTNNVDSIVTIGASPDGQMILIKAMESGRFTAIRHQKSVETPKSNHD